LGKLQSWAKLLWNKIQTPQNEMQMEDQIAVIYAANEMAAGMALALGLACGQFTRKWSIG